MDILVEIVDTFIADYAYAYLFPIEHSNKTDFNAFASPAAHMSSLARDNPFRQFCTLFIGTWLFVTITYFIYATLLYHLMFDKRYINHPNFLKNQIWMEIKVANISIFVIAILTAPWLVLEVRGYTKLYDTTADGPGWWYDILQIPLILLYSDFCIYWIHRLGHHPRVYKHFLYMHKLHHSIIIPTPYASHAVHPFEGFTLALPFIILPFILPLHETIRAVLYYTANLWTIGLHDGKFLSNNRIVCGTACHSLHHLHRDCNFGQFFTLFDRLFGTYRGPETWMFQEERWLFEIQRTKEFQTVKEVSKRNDGYDDVYGMYQANSKNKKDE